MLTLDRASPPLFVLRLPGARPDRAGD
jgi:hypothetical protein